MLQKATAANQALFQNIVVHSHKQKRFSYSKCTKSVWRQGYAAKPAGELTVVPHTSSLDFRWPLHSRKGREGKGQKGIRGSSPYH